jgi:KaiC/GvpD/RAD55 family RecA-like ATPase
MDAAWIEFLRGGATPQHAAQVYGEIDELGASVAGYLAAGFAVGEPAIVVATPEHWACFAEQLAGCGWDADKVTEAGLLHVVDADSLLESFMLGTSPDPELFQLTVGALVESVAARFPDTTVRAFGEMVDLLCERGQPAAAASLEDLWNDLARRQRFSLLCGYGQGADHSELCRSHSRVLVA